MKFASREKKKEPRLQFRLGHFSSHYRVRHRHCGVYCTGKMKGQIKIYAYINSQDRCGL